MKPKSICDRQPLFSLHRWRRRLSQELRRILRGRDLVVSERDMEQLPSEAQELLRAYDELSVEIARQNCARQCALLERFKGDAKADPDRIQEMSAWWWQRY